MGDTNPGMTDRLDGGAVKTITYVRFSRPRFSFLGMTVLSTLVTNILNHEIFAIPNFTMGDTHPGVTDRPDGEND